MVGHMASVLVFLAAITIVAELADAAGVFDAGARIAERVGRGRVPVLWLGFVVLATASTVFLSLDTTAVLLTPVVLTAARRLDLPALPFAMTTVWLANTASLLLPVSNLTNLLALPDFARLGVGYRATVALTAGPALTAVLVTVAVLALMFGRRLRGRYPDVPAQRPPDRLAFVVASVVCLALAPAFVSGVPVVYPAVVAALALLVLFAVRRRSVLTPRLVPWGALAFAAGMFVVVGLAGRWGLTGLLTGLLPVGAGRSAVFALGATAGVAANTVDNLPAFVALGAVAGDHPHRLAAVLIGTNVAPLITPWASLANLLWHQRCARAGVTIRWSSFAWRGAVVSVLATSASLAVLTWR